MVTDKGVIALFVIPVSAKLPLLDKATAPRQSYRSSTIAPALSYYRTSCTYAHAPYLHPCRQLLLDNCSSTIAPRQLLLHCSTTVHPAHMHCSTTVHPAHMHCTTTVHPVHMLRHWVNHIFDAAWRRLQPHSSI